MVIDHIFSALAHPVRRGMLEQLLSGGVTVKELARPYDMTAGAISQHLGLLERARLITREVRGRNHHVRLNKSGMEPMIDWFHAHEAFWTEQLDCLQAFVESPSFEEEQSENG